MLKKLSKKHIGIKIVISDLSSIEPFEKAIKEHIDKKYNNYPDYIALTSLMERVSPHIQRSVFIVDNMLKVWHKKVC